MRSNLHAKDWHGAITLFNGFTGTRPTHEETCSAARLAEVIAPTDGPQIVANKERGLYFVPCLLREAPLTGKTLEFALKRGDKTTGKMRSAAHVTEGAVIKLDIDGASREQFDGLLAKLEECRLAHLAYSTHSHGRADKPGIRCRVILLLDRALAAPEYLRTVLACSAWLQGNSLDPSEARLSQQAGVWTAHPDRTGAAFCLRRLDGFCLSADSLLESIPAPTESRSSHTATEDGQANFDAERVAEALAWLDANEYSAWVSAAIWLKAAFGDVARSTWLAWSQTATEEHRADESQCQDIWVALAPIINAQAGAGTLYVAARDSAVKAVEAAANCGNWSGKGKHALVYLRRFHPRLYEQLFGVVA
jgi:hypothetical protein